MVAVGTHEQPFQRLLNAAHECAVLLEHTSWVIQYGVGSWESSKNTIDSAAYFDSAQMQEHLRWADVLVSQASPGNTFSALEHGAWPLVLGRSSKLREHVDDHQLRFAEKLQDMGKATNIVTEENLRLELLGEEREGQDSRAARIERSLLETKANSTRFRADVWQILKEAN